MGQSCSNYRLLGAYEPAEEVACCPIRHARSLPHVAVQVGPETEVAPDQNCGIAVSYGVPFHPDNDLHRCIVHMTRRSNSRTVTPRQSPRGVQEHAHPDDRTVVLAWVLNFSHQASTEPSKLESLNQHIAMCNSLFGTETLWEEATAGLIRGRALESERLSAEDTAVRLGQLICRWGAQHKLRIRVGVHVGKMRSVTFTSSGRTSWFGEASALALELAVVSGQDCFVHFSTQVKEGLQALRLMRVMISPSQSSYFLDPATTVPSYNAAFRGEGRSRGPTDTMILSLSEDGGAFDRRGATSRRDMSMTEFEQLLRTHNVDVSKFGHGLAKPLSEFYQAVVKEQKSYLVVQEGSIERVVNLVRISLRIRDNDHKLRELRVASQATTTGAVRMRDQPLAVVLKIPEHGQWHEAIEACFEQKLQISGRVQKMCFSTDLDSYSVKEERADSETIPGIPTIYKSHNIVINVKDKTSKDLRLLGLPGGDDFATGEGGNVKTWTWALVEDRQEDELMSLLQTHGIDVSEFAPQAFSELYDEVYGKMNASLDVQCNELVRTIRVIKVWLHAHILNVDHVLVVKAKYQKGQFDAMNKDTPISMRMSVEQDWAEAVEAALLTRLGLTPAFQASHLGVDKASHKLTEEVGFSRSYPGLKTIYTVNEVNVHVLNSTNGNCQFIGLPAGTDFTFARRELAKGPEAEDVVITHWCWKTRESMEQLETSFIRRSVDSAPSVSDDHLHPDDAEHNVELFTICEEEGASATTWEDVLRHRVPCPEPLFLGSHLDVNSDLGALESLMASKKTDWKRAKRAAERILDPKYSAKDFHNDVVGAFPELRLYCVVHEDQKTTISGRTADDEYQRTVGALLALFWIMRLDIGGKESFCFGVDKSWQPRKMADPKRDEDELKKRKEFMEKTDWRTITGLLVDAGLLVQGKRGITHDPERTLAMLVLLAIHDIMKMSVLLPTVKKEIAQFCGYKSGETINDHDAALSYVLVHGPQMLPSFAGLSKIQRQSVQFTHCKLEYNMGWLVQAEAPPGALFKTFKQVIKEGNAPAADIAFYFVHWFCDLAAAEPAPLEGCEKFVLKFPQRVLSQFLASFNVVQTLGTHLTETQVLQEYLIVRWDPELGPAPVGRGAIAQMRVTLMAQADSKEIVSSFHELPCEDQVTLSEEMAITGIRDQAFTIDPVLLGGPAILVYYSPALMQRAGRKDPRGAMRILAEVFRRARELWPCCIEGEDQTVTIRIDALKELETSVILRPEPGYTWVLGKTSSKDAMVKLLPVSALQDIDWATHKLLCFGSGPGKITRRNRRVSTFFSSIPRVRRFSLWG